MADKIPSKFLIKDKQVEEPYLTASNLIPAAIDAVDNIALLYQGEDNFTSSLATIGNPYTTIVLSTNLPAGILDNYSVLITPSEDPGGYLGEVWVDYKTQNSFRVNISGTAETQFDWFLFVKYLG